jgi:drug/metabolite transporter (DMT)-like permease
MAWNQVSAGGVAQGDGVNQGIDIKQELAHEKSGSQRTMWANAALALAGCLWGTGFLGGKIAFREMTVSENVVFRFVAACLVLAPILFKKRDFFRGTDFWLLMLASAVGVPLQFLVQFKGLQLTTVSHASLIVGTLPVLIALASVAVLHERFKTIEWAVLLVSPAGVLLIAFSTVRAAQGSQATLGGDLLVMLSMFAAVAMILITKHLTAEYDSLQVTAWMLIIGTAMLVLGTELWHPVRFQFSAAVWAAAIAQGFFATASAYLLWNWALAQVPASRAGVFLNLEPILGTLLGVVFLREALGWLTILGGAMILGPAIYFSRKPAA